MIQNLGSAVILPNFITKKQFLRKLLEYHKCFTPASPAVLSLSKKAK